MSVSQVTSNHVAKTGQAMWSLGMMTRLVTSRISRRITPTLVLSSGEQLYIARRSSAHQRPRRYANRIKNGTFTVGTETSHIPENENGGKDTLHGGTMGYDAVSRVHT